VPLKAISSSISALYGPFPSAIKPSSKSSIFSYSSESPFSSSSSSSSAPDLWT